MLRIVVTLALLLTAFRGVDDLGRSDTAMCGACASGHACLVAVKTTDSCDLRANGVACLHSDGECRCEMKPLEEERRPIPMPMPDRGQGLVLALPTVAPGVRLWSLNAKPIAPDSRALSPHALHTHNEVQALLGVWRT